jgi:hypothetical protein
MEIFNNAKNYILENNITENSYHNNSHMIDVFNNSIALFNLYKDAYKLDLKDELCLGLASLFHDFNHSGGKLKDIENIENSLNGLLKYLKTINKLELFDDIKSIILATEFPHKDIELSILQKIIRDADTMGGIKDNWIVVVESLAKEYGKTLKDFIPSQITFLENANFNTEYCNELLNKNKNNIINELKELEDNIKNN